MLVPSAEASAMLGLFQRRVRQYEPANRIEPTLN
jgi:hypothetical protein